MARVTGTYQVTDYAGEKVRAFLPHPLPPKNPGFQINVQLAELHSAALSALGRLAIAGEMVPSAKWFLYGFVRKEAVVSSQIEGTQATLEDVVAFEATRQSKNPADVEEVCNYVEALRFARAEMARPKGLPLCAQLLCETHARLMKGVRGAEKQPGRIRTSQNWIGGTRPGNARFVPPPHDAVPRALSDLDKWIHGDDRLPPLVRIGLAHVQFETIHPFLDGNGRIGRLLITLLVEHWKLQASPLLYLSLSFKRQREEYYRRLSAVRTEGDWEGWTAFFLECVRDAAEDGIQSARRLFTQIETDRRKLIRHPSVTVPTIQLFDFLPDHPMLTSVLVVKLLKTSKPTAINAINVLMKAGILQETTGRKRDRVFAYRNYLNVLSEDTELLDPNGSSAAKSDSRKARTRSKSAPEFSGGRS